MSLRHPVDVTSVEVTFVTFVRTVDVHSNLSLNVLILRVSEFEEERPFISSVGLSESSE